MGNHQHIDGFQALERMSIPREKCREKRDPRSKPQVTLIFRRQGRGRGLGKGDKKVQPEMSQEKQESTVSCKAREKRVSRGRRQIT